MRRRRLPLADLFSGPREGRASSSRVRLLPLERRYWVLAFARSLIFAAKSITWNV
jgi:hypothetical protein